MLLYVRNHCKCTTKYLIDNYFRLKLLNFLIKISLLVEIQ